MDREHWAKQKATLLLAGDERRLAHTRAVATCASSLAGKLVPDCNDRATLAAAAWLHDIGYAPKLAMTGAHHIDGACHLTDIGEDRLARLVAHHGSGEAEAALRGLGAEFAQFRREASMVDDILTYCDMHTGPDGSHVDLAQRLSEVRARYGDDHVVVRGLAGSSDRIEGAISRVEKALRQAQLSG
jgi:HD superfamily phosphodiesterase